MNYTEIIFVLDKSGSMYNLAADTIGGFNGFISSQKKVEGKATLTTVLFDSTWRILHDGIDIREVQPMTASDYVASGNTAMLDAIGEIINRVQDRHDEIGTERPDNVLFVITTDGEENASRQFNKSQIEKMIQHQTRGHGWEFIFLGANMDAVKEAASIGISANRSVTYDYSASGIDALYATMDCVATAARCEGSISNSISDIYTDVSAVDAVTYIDKTCNCDGLCATCTCEEVKATL